MKRCIMQTGYSYDVPWIYDRWGIKPRACTDDLRMAAHVTNPEMSGTLQYLTSIYGSDVTRWKELNKSDKNEN